MQEIQKYKSKNGIEVIFIIDKRFTTSSIVFGFCIGYGDDDKKTEGLAHLFEHLVGKRTKTFKNKGEFNAEINKNGIYINALTYADHTVYYHNQSHDNMGNSLDFMLEAVYNSFFDKNDLEQEKLIVLNEGKQRDSKDREFALSENRKMLFKDMSLSKSVFGNEKTMKNINIETFESFYQNYFSTKNTTILISIDKKTQVNKIIKQIDSFKFDNFNNKKIVKNKETFSKIVSSKNITKPNKLQANVVIGFREDKLSTRELVTFNLLREYLSGSLSAVFYKRLRDELGFIYSISMNGYNERDFLNVSIFCETDKKNVKDLLKEIEIIFKNTSESFTQQDIDNVIKKLLFALDAGIDSLEDALYVYRTYLDQNKLVSVDEYKEMLKSITPEEVKALVNKIFKKENKAVFCLS